MFNRGCFTWSSHKQTSVSLSTAEAKYISAVHAAKTIAWLQTLLQELGLISNKPTNFCVNSLSAIALVDLNDSVNERLKHIEIHYHWICDTPPYPLKISIIISISPLQASIAH